MPGKQFSKVLYEKELIIDTHVHLTPPFIINKFAYYRQREPYFDLLCSSPVNKNVTGEQLIKHLDQTGVGRAVVFGFAFSDNQLCCRVNDYIIAQVNKYPDRLMGFAVVNPRSEEAIKELRRCKNAGLKGIGELLPSGQNFTITAKKDLTAICDFARENRWPILVHFNESVGHYYPGKTADSLPEAIKLAHNFPEVTFIYAHLGGGLCFYELMPEVKETLRNVYYDTAAVPYLYQSQIYDTLQAAGISGKIIMGSDYPLLSPGKYLAQIKRSNLNVEEKTAILGRTFEKIMVGEGRGN